MVVSALAALIAERMWLGDNFTLGNAIRAAFLGAVGAAVPDAMEPPTWPGHRGFCHSLAAGAITLKLGFRDMGEASLFFRPLAVGVLGHLALDGTTAKRIPLINR